jgi:hypothetical protein
MNFKGEFRKAMGSAPLLFLLLLGHHHVRLSAIGPCQVQEAFRDFCIFAPRGIVGLLSQEFSSFAMAHPAPRMNIKL